MARTSPVTLHALASEPAGGAGAIVDLVQMTTLRLALAVTEVAGTSSTLSITIETSSDRATWSVLGAFVAATAAGSQAVALTSASRYVRARWAIAGTGAAFTFSVTGVAALVYATPDDLNVFGVPNPVIDSLTIAEKDRYLSAASDKADGLIQNHHALPLLAWGDDLREAVCSLAVWAIMSKRVGFNPEQGADLAIRKNYEDAMSMLKMVASGDAELAGVVDSTPIEDDGGAFVYSDAPRGWQ